MKYKTAEAFREALEARLNNEARSSGRPLDYLRKHVAFERFLARLFSPGSHTWPFVLKGAFALSLLARARRTTKDLDLALNANDVGPAPDILDLLQEAAERDVGDFFHFRVSSRAGDRPQEPAARRLAVEAILAGRTFERFALDVAVEPLDPEAAEDRPLPGFLAFAEVQAPVVRAVHPARQYADKLHAYTRPRAHRSRVKDLVDLALLTLELAEDPEVPDQIRREVDRVYDLYPTHQPWGDLPQPPSEWRPAFRNLAEEVGLEPPNMEHWFQKVNGFYRTLRPPVP